MKKLNLLEPALIKGYARFHNVDQEVTYLRIDEILDKVALKADIALGAKQFAECLSAAEKGLSRVVVIRAKNEEEGLMAVNYLSGICNAEDGVYEEDDLEESLKEEAAYEDILKDVELYFDDCEEDTCDDDDEIWEESVSRVPIVTMQELNRHWGGDQTFFDNSFIMSGRSNIRNAKPYWFDCTHEKICVVINYVHFYTTGIIYRLNFSCYDDDIMRREVERYKFRKGKRHGYNESFI